MEELFPGKMILYFFSNKKHSKWFSDELWCCTDGNFLFIIYWLYWLYRLIVRRFEFFSTFFLLFFILTFDFLYLKYEGQCLVVTSPNKCFLLRSVKACHINSGIYGFCFIFPWQKPWCRFPYICQFKSFDANSFMQSNIFFASSDLI